MATQWGLTCLFIGLNILQNCVAHPMDYLLSGSEGPNGQVMGVLVAVMVSVCVVFVLVACVCCKRRSGFKENENEKKVFRNSPVSASVINETSLSGEDPGHVNPIANAEFTIFTPLSPPHHNNNVFRSQPPVICYTENEAAPELNKAVNPQIDGIDVSDWFADTEYDFPRSRLKYIRELGTGWFGRVIEGEAHGIDPPDNPTWVPVAVRILESSAPASEQAQFLHEAAVFRAGAHPNLLRLLGRSLEATPLLLIQEFCPRGDLKKFLLENRECKDSEVMAGVPLTFCCQLAAVVQFLHEKNLPHLDLAARTCQITSDLNLKLGDYGLAVTQYPNDYYQGTPSIPVRWCAPESVNHTNTTLQPKQVTLEANIWSLAVTFWEICEWGRLPYDWLSDDEVVSQVMDGQTRLSQPTLNAYYIPPLYRLMEYCWLPDQSRPQINQIYSMLIHLTKTYTPSTQSETNDFSTETFDLRWESFKPNTIIKTDNAKTKSASLTNLHGSFENLEATDTVIQMDSWLENVASHTGDMQYVRGLSEAIHELDTALASEQTSSSSSFEPTPNSSLGPARSETILHTDDSLIFVKRSESGSETEDETWRKRIERGAYSEKVKQKSKSVADLMVLTHIDMSTVKDIFQEEIKKMQEERRESLLFVPVQPDQDDNMAERSFELPGDHFIGHLRRSMSEECFVQADKLLKVTETPNSLKKESQIEESKKNLFKSPETNLVLETITDNKSNKTVPSVSNSKLEDFKLEPEIKLVESNQTATDTTNQETSNFDTFLQPQRNQIDTIESKVILMPETDNQNMLSNKILDETKNTTLISTQEKSLVKETNSQETVTDETILSQTPEILMKSEEKIEHIEPISFKSGDLSLIQDFINSEKNYTSLTIPDKVDEIAEKSLQKEVPVAEELIGKTDEPETKDSAIITTQIRETSTINLNLELETEKLQPDEIISEIVDNEVKNDLMEEIKEEKSVINLNLEHATEKLQPDNKSLESVDNKAEKEILPQVKNDLLEENKESLICEKLDTSLKSSENLKEIIRPENPTDISPQINEICEKNNQSIDLNISNDKILHQTTEIINVDDESPTIDKASPVTEICDNIVESQLKDEIKEVVITKTDDKLHKVTNEMSVDKQMQEPETLSTLIPEISENLKLQTKKLQEISEINLKIVPEVKEITEESLVESDDDEDMPELILDESIANKLQSNDPLVEDLLQNVSNTLINIPPPQQFVETPTENNQIMDLPKEEIITDVKSKTENVDLLVQCDETSIDKKENVDNQPKMEETEILKTETNESQSNEPVNIEINDNMIKDETTNIQSVTLDIKEPTTVMSEIVETPEVNSKNTEIIVPLAEIASDSEISTSESKDVSIIEEKEVNQQELPKIQFEAKLIDNFVTESKITSLQEQIIKQDEPVITVKSDDFSLIQNFINNERNNNQHDLITSEIYQKSTEESNLNLPPVSSELTADLLNISSFQQINVDNKINDNQQHLIPSAPTVNQKSNEINENLITIPSDLTPDLLGTLNIQETNQALNINNDKNSNQQDLVPLPADEVNQKSKEENTNVSAISSELTSDLLDISNVLKIDPIFNVNNETKSSQLDLIPTEVTSAIEINKKDSEEKSNLPIVSSDLTSDLLDKSDVKQINPFSVNNDKKNDQQDLIPSEVTFAPEINKKNSEDILNLPSVSSELTSDLLGISNDQQINQVYSVNNERSSTQQDLIPSPAVKLYQKTNEENSDLQTISSELTSNLLDRSNAQQYNQSERNNNQQDLNPSEVSPPVEVNQKNNEEKSNLPPISSDLTSDLLDTSNVQQINQVFNVFSVTVDHKPPPECFTSPVKNFYALPFDQNEIITDINSLLESERRKYENKNSVCTSSLQNDFLPFVNGIKSELSDKIIDILNEKEENVDNKPKKLSEIAYDSLKNNPEYCEEEKITNGYDERKELHSKIGERPKKLSELVLDSLKTNSMSEDSGIVSLKCEENGIKDAEGSNEDLLKISADSLDDILSNTDENIEDKYENDIITEVRKIAEDVVSKILDEAPEKLSEKLNNNSLNYEELITSFVEEEKCVKNIEQVPKTLSEIVQDNLNKTFDVSPNLPDIVLDNLQNTTFVKDVPEKEEILINVINDSPVKSLNSLSDKFEENSESAIEDDKNILNIDSPRKLSEIILDSLPCNSPVTSESTDNVSDKTVIEVKISDDNNQTCDENNKSEVENFETPNFPTSTPFKPNLMPKKTDTNDSFFSFVSEGDEPSDCQTRVILGPCEEYGLGLYSGLKTTFGKFSDDDRPEEELLQFSSNFMSYNEPETTHNSVDYSLETWDKFLGKSLQEQDTCPNSVFDNFSPREDSIDVFGKNKKETEIENTDLNKTVTLTNHQNNNTFTIENEVPAAEIKIKEDESDQTETTQNSWEPGEGWFLHPQTGADDLTGQIDISGGDNVDNSYVGFALDEECVNALRNELAAKLPHAQGMSHEEPQEPEEWDSEERNEVIVKYNVYATPLSPIPEESCCDDVYCDQIQHRDGSDSESEWSEPCLGQTSQLEEDILVVDTETHTALILESPSLREPQHRHTPSQDSCCSNDTLFNLEDLNYGLSPQHQGLTTSAQLVDAVDSDQIEIEIIENETPKHSPIKEIPKIETENSDSTEMNLTYTKPDINIETSNHQTVSGEEPTKTKLELKLDPNAFGVAPLPSPEDIPWRQLPASLLTYNEVVQNDKFEIQDSEDCPTIENVDQEDLNLAAENTNDDLSDSVRDCTLDVDLYSNLTDIRFSGPCDAQLMSTSFSESADYAEERDWDSGSDTRSSSSGEFIWKEGEHEESLRALHAASHDVGVTEELNPMDAIEEENSNSSEDSDDCEEDMEETEFVPSAWDAQATPTKSALRSPEKSTKRKTPQKGVWFKKQKYHCVYEYPREPESPVAPPTDLWRPLSDLSTFADWELDPESCVPASFEDSADGGYDVLDKFITRSNYPLASGNARHRDLYQLNPFPDFAPGLPGSDEDFFISSSARPFQAVGQSSQFFPGQNNPPKSKFLWQDYQSSSQQSSRDLSEGITPDSGIDDVTPASSSESGLIDILPSRNQKVPPLKCLAAIAANKTPPAEQKSVDSSLGGLRHTRNRLKLDLPPSPNSFSSTRTFSIDISNDPVINREIPTFTTFGKSRFSVQHVTTPTDDCSDPLLLGKPKIKNVSFEALPHKPMKLTETVYILDKSEDDGKKPVEMVQGEASLLDSADEDSGIESSANATLERHQQQILN